MLTLHSFLSGEADRVVYWGTSGEKITNKYKYEEGIFDYAETLSESIQRYADILEQELRDF